MDNHPPYDPTGFFSQQEINRRRSSAVEQLVDAGRIEIAGDAAAKVLAWLGYWRDGLEPEAIAQLQEIAQQIRSMGDD